jgi:hypothetical protein
VLQDEPLTSLAFFHKLRRNHYPPYYSIPGIHAPTEVNDLDDNIEPIKTLEAGLLNRQADELAVGADKMHTKEMGVDEIGAHELGADETGADKTGADKCKGNLTDLRRILHLSLAKGNPKLIYKSK